MKSLPILAILALAACTPPKGATVEPRCSYIVDRREVVVHGNRRYVWRIPECIR